MHRSGSLLARVGWSARQSLCSTPLASLTSLQQHMSSPPSTSARHPHVADESCSSCKRSFSAEAVHEHHHGGRSYSEMGLTPEQVDMKRMAQDFAAQELLPHAASWDANKTFPLPTLRKAAQLGLGGMYVREDVGGTGLSRSDGVLVVEALAYGDVSVTAFLTIHNMVAYVLDRFGSPELRQRYLPSLTQMDTLASYCLTEPGSGSDAASLSTTAVRHGDEYVLNGSKAFISGAGVSDLYLVMARTGESGPKGISAFMVEKDWAGVSFGKEEDKLGWRAQPTRAVTLDNVRVPAANRVGQEGQGFKIAMHALDGGRVNIAAVSVGAGQFCVDYAAEYVKQRVQFGRPIGAFQHTQFQLADMATAVQAARLMVRHAAHTLDIKAPSATLDAAMAKRFATDSCYDVSNAALQLLGGYGYLRDYPVERYMRDLRVNSILEGTNQIMRLIIHRELEKLG